MKVRYDLLGLTLLAAGVITLIETSPTHRSGNIAAGLIIYVVGICLVIGAIEAHRMKRRGSPR